MIEVRARTFSSDEDPSPWTPDQGNWKQAILFPTAVLLSDEQGDYTLVPYTSLDNISFSKEDEVIIGLENT